MRWTRWRLGADDEIRSAPGERSSHGWHLGVGGTLLLLLVGIVLRCEFVSIFSGVSAAVPGANQALGSAVQFPAGANLLHFVSVLVVSVLEDAQKTRERGRRIVEQDQFRYFGLYDELNPRNPSEANPYPSAWSYRRIASPISGQIGGCIAISSSRRVRRSGYKRPEDAAVGTVQGSARSRLSVACARSRSALILLREDDPGATEAVVRKAHEGDAS